ncbi:MAG: nicotinamide-nucleotide adenylyltransferase [Candidatus Helarchaeota archaeon]
MKRGVFIGRFQPLHNGHLEAIKKILKDVDEIIIMIGSSQYSHSFDNPFTAGERIQMIRRAFQEENIDANRYMIIPIADANDNRIWVSHVVSFLPDIDVFYSNNPLVARLLREKGYHVQNFDFIEREVNEGTKIRSAILKGNDEWEKHVPPAIVKEIERIDGINRMKEIGSTVLKQ